jgi:hypothetical protein
VLLGVLLAIGALAGRDDDTRATMAANDPEPSAAADPAEPPASPTAVVKGVEALTALAAGWSEAERRDYCRGIRLGSPTAEAGWWDGPLAESEYGFRVPSAEAVGFVRETCPDSDGDGVVDASDAYPRNARVSERQTVTIQCTAGRKYERVFTIDRVRPDFSNAWTTDFPKEVWCEASSGWLPEPVTAVEEADWGDVRRRFLPYVMIPYEQCVEHGTEWTVSRWPVSEAQVREAEQTLRYCPRHPDAAAIRGRIEAMAAAKDEARRAREEEARLRAEGRLIEDGVSRVGVSVQPGTYVTGPVDGCYWERQNSAGGIIDNYFTTGALRVEVTIQPTDYAFVSQDCGTWSPL